MLSEERKWGVGSWRLAVGRKKVLRAECGVRKESGRWAVGLSLEREKSEYYYRMSFIETLCTNIKHNWACCFSANVTGVMG